MIPHSARPTVSFVAPIDLPGGIMGLGTRPVREAIEAGARTVDALLADRQVREGLDHESRRFCYRAWLAGGGRRKPETLPFPDGFPPFSALADRGLVEVNWHARNIWGQLKPHVRLTPAGRRLGRSWTGTKAYKTPPAGTLKEWHWRALTKAYAAGDAGLEGSYGDYANIGWNTLLRLRDYKRGALIEERASGSWHNPATGSSGSRYRIHITGAGWALGIDQASLWSSSMRQRSGE